MKAKFVFETISRYGKPTMNSIHEDGEDIWKDVRYGGEDKPKNTLAYDPRNKASIDFICDKVEEYMDELIFKHRDITNQKEFDKAFNNDLRELVPELKFDNRNFYKIALKFGPQ